MLKPVLQKGYYFYDGKNIYKTTFVNKIKHPILIKKTNNKNVECIQFGKTGRGKCKLCLLTDEFVYAFSFNKNNYFEIKKRYEEFNELLKYKKIKILEFNDNFQYIKMELAKGIRFQDSDHKQKILDYLFSTVPYNKMIEENGIILSVQHGDTTWGNIVWDNKDFRFIDLDSIGYKPFLFDIIYFASLNLNGLKTIVTYCEKYKEILNNCLKNFDSEFDKNVLDKYLNQYVLYWKDFSNFSLVVPWKKDPLLEDFPLTRHSISLIFNNAKI